MYPINKTPVYNGRFSFILRHKRLFYDKMRRERKRKGHHRMISFETSCITSLKECTSVAKEDLWHVLVEQGKTNVPILSVERLLLEPSFRNKGIGKAFLRHFCQTHKDEHLILVVAGLLEEEYEQPSEEFVKEKLAQLEWFYTSVGFVNVNHIIGQYEYKTVYLYDDGIGKEIALPLKKKAGIACF